MGPSHQSLVEGRVVEWKRHTFVLTVEASITPLLSRGVTPRQVHVMNLAETEMGSTESKIGFDGAPEQVQLAKGVCGGNARGC